VPLYIIGKHAQEHVGADAVGEPVMDRPDLEIDGLDAAEGPFHSGERFVAAHRAGIIKGFRRQAGAHDIEAVGCGFGGDLIVLAGETEAGICNIEAEVLGHLVLADHGADLQRDLGGASQRSALALDGRLDAAQIALGRLQKFQTLAFALGGEIGIAAHHETLTGKFRRGDAGHVAVIEQ